MVPVKSMKFRAQLYYLGATGKAAACFLSNHFMNGSLYFFARLLAVLNSPAVSAQVDIII
jgi:hypothetical protein